MGVRYPLWASPYSAQATAALKAQFPTQWPTIRDYGFAHPEIVPYVNQYPVGWGNIIVGFQLCEYIQATGTQGIQLEVGASTTAKIEYKIAFTEFRNGDRDWFVGNRQEQTNWLVGYYSGRNCHWGGSGYYYAGNLAVNQIVVQSIDFKNDVLTADGNSTSIGNISPSTKGMMLFLGNGSSLGNGTKNKLYYLRSYEDDVENCYVVPCYNKDNGKIGLYDVVNSRFYENAGSGTFLKGSDIYYPGQSPS